MNSFICFLTLVTWLLALIAQPLDAQSKKKLFPLSIIHINDFHDRFDEITTKAKICKDQNCIGGYARTVFLLKKLIKKREKANQNPIYLNAGDNFQGTTWYTLLHWNMTVSLMNMFPPKAMTLGNHEFDGQIKDLSKFLSNINAPVLVANMDVTEEPSLHDKLKKSIILKKGNRTIGIIGVIYDKTNLIAGTGKVRFTNSSAAIVNEAKKLKKDGVKIIIVLSHCGYNIDLEMARETEGLVDVIVGGHTHTFLYTGSPPGIDKAEARYPTVIEIGQHKTLIVQSLAYGKYVGNLLVNFDEKGEVVNWSGNPVYVDKTVKKDKLVNKKLSVWREKVEAIASKQVTTSKISWPRTKCRLDECDIGLLVADSMVDYYINDLKKQNIIGFLHGGGIRTELEKGNVTYGDLIQVVPYASTVDICSIKGKYIKEALEHSALFDKDEQKYNFLQPSGMKYTVDLSKPKKNRVCEVKVRNKSGKFVPLVESKMYSLVSTSYVLAGNDGFKMLKDHSKDHKVGPLDIDVLTNYVKKLGTLKAIKNQRLIVKNKKITNV